MMEKKYIDAGAFILLAKERFPRACPSDFADGYLDVLRQLEDAPAADVQEVRHGKWIFHISEIFPTDSTKECSFCHEEQDLDCDENYCPHCGAKMDGGEDDEA